MQGDGRELLKGQHIRTKPEDRKGGWFQGAGVVGEAWQGDTIVLSITPLSPQKQVLEEALEMLLFFVSTWAGIGSRQQHGYGVVDIRNADDSPISPSETKVKTLLCLASRDRPRLRREETPPDLPTLKGCFFAKYRLENLPGGWEQKIDGRPTNRQDHIER